MEHPPAQPPALGIPHLAAQTSSRGLLEQGGGPLLFTTTTTYTFADSPGKLLLLLLEGGRSSQQAARSGICGQKTQSKRSVRVLLGSEAHQTSDQWWWWSTSTVLASDIHAELAFLSAVITKH